MKNGLLRIAAQCWIVHETLKHQNKNIQYRITIHLMVWKIWIKEWGY